MTYKYRVDYTSDFKKEYKKIKKQGKDINKIRTIIEQLACGNTLESQYKDNKLNDNKRFKDCRECHMNLTGYLCIELIIMNLFYY